MPSLAALVSLLGPETTRHASLSGPMFFLFPQPGTLLRGSIVLVCWAGTTLLLIWEGLQSGNPLSPRQVGMVGHPTSSRYPHTLLLHFLQDKIASYLTILFKIVPSYPHTHALNYLFLHLLFSCGT